MEVGSPYLWQQSNASADADFNVSQQYGYLCLGHRISIQQK